MIKGVSIGIPIYNEATRIEKAVRSAVDQCEVLLIGDNASTDGSSEICRRLASEFPNIIYERHAVNRGSTFNGNSIMAKISTPYCCYLGGHDFIEPNYIPTLKNILDYNPDVVLAAGSYPCFFLDDESPDIKTFPDYPLQLNSDSPFERVNYVASAITTQSLNRFLLNGLCRTELLRRSCINVPRIGPDHVTMLRLAQAGKIAIDERAVFHAGVHRVPLCKDSVERITGREVNPESIKSAKSMLAKHMMLHVLRSDKLSLAQRIKAFKTRVQLSRCFEPFRFGARDWQGSLCKLLMISLDCWSLLRIRPRLANNKVLHWRLAAFLASKHLQGDSLIGIFGTGPLTTRILGMGLIPLDKIKYVFDEKPSKDNFWGIPVLPASEMVKHKVSCVLASNDENGKGLFSEACQAARHVIPVARLDSWKMFTATLKTKD